MESGQQEASQRIAEARRSKTTILNLSDLGLTAIPDALGELPQLLWLDLSSNEISEIPESLGELSQLRRLDLSNNQISAIPEFFRKFSRLRRLDLSNNQITAIPESFVRLVQLQELYLNNNQITHTPDVIGHLSQLQELGLSRNRLTAIPESFSRLSRLRRLQLSENEITSIPDSLALIPKIQYLELDRNPLPQEILASLQRGMAAFFRYLKSTRKVRPRTVKLVLLGEPKSGKTTLLEALKGNPDPCDESRLETMGVNVALIEKPHPGDGKPMYLSVWDFAGQHMEHATHQFFLSEDAVYLILWNARLGADFGKRDLWYWLELLKMRVRNANFLLVATHTERTPPDLNLSEIEQSYKGYQGQCPVDLCDLKGFASLQTKILQLASKSPALGAEWPADWLPVRDEIRRVRHRRHYLPPDEFLDLMATLGVNTAVAQQDLAHQLHNLGEILYFQERDELSHLVVLNPEWVTELIALVVRSKQARNRHGILTKDDLDELWKEFDLSPAVRQYLIHLMDWFDLTSYTGQDKEIGIVVEALPYCTPEDLREIALTADLPQSETIFRFSSLQRHLPPGVPTWGIARAHRLSSHSPWRNAAAFADPETNSHAIVLASDAEKEVRLRVAADYPPYFFGRIEAILRDTFRRYPGLEPERRLPCRCRPQCPTSYLFETVIKRRNAGKADVTCDVSGEDVNIETLLSGARRTDTEAGFRALQSDVRRLATEAMRAQREVMENTCPSIFTLVPSTDFKLTDTWFESITQDDELELVLYCEDDTGWHPTSQSLYRFRPAQEWLSAMHEYWNGFVQITKFVAPLAKVIGKAAGVAWPGIEVAASAVEKLPLAEHLSWAERGRALGRHVRPEFVDFQTRLQLKRLINDLDEKRQDDSRNGGLYQYLIDDGRVLWLCPKHRRLYQDRK